MANVAIIARDRRSMRLRSAAAALLATALLAASGLVSSATGPLTASGPTATVATTADVDPAVTDALRAAGTVDVVVQADRAALTQVVAAAEAAGAEILLELPIVDGFSATIDADALETLRSTSGVRAITLDGAVKLQHEPAPGEAGGDSFFPETVHATDLHKQGADGSGVGIAVIDTGVTEVGDLAGRVVGAVDLSGDYDDVDHYGHGTFIAGIAAGNGAASNGKHAGVAPGAHIVPVKIAGRNGAADVSHVLAAMQYVVSFKDTYDIGVLNLSLGTDSTQPYRLSPLNYAVERAWDAGIVVVVSGGNLGEQGPGRIPKPADDPLVITVGAVDSNGTRNTKDDTVAAYSSRGPSIADGIVKPDIVAPGSHLIGLKAPGSALDENHPEAHIGEDYARGSGTSFAAGVVSGAAALLLDAHPEWTNNQVKSALTGTAAPGPVGDRNVDGHGIVDVAAAAALVDPAPANQGVLRSSGLGSLDADRGTLEIAIEKQKTLLSGLVETVVKLLDGEMTAQDLLFDADEFSSTDWTSSSWYSSSWYSSSWYSSSWYSSSWYSSSWYSSSWYSSSWY